MPASLSSYRFRRAAGALNSTSVRDPVLVVSSASLVHELAPLRDDITRVRDQSTVEVADLERALVGRGADALLSEPMVYELCTASGQESPPAGLLLGRTPPCDLVFTDPSISRQHARLIPDGRSGTWSVVDMGSRNGTWLRDKQLAPQRR